MKKIVVVSLVIASLTGGVAGWLVRDRQAWNETRALIVARDIANASHAVSTLKQLPADAEKARALQMLQLRSAMEGLGEMTREPVEMEIPTPQLREGLVRVRDYAGANAMPDIAAQADRVLARVYPETE